MAETQLSTRGLKYFLAQHLVETQFVPCIKYFWVKKSTLKLGTSPYVHKPKYLSSSDNCSSVNPLALPDIMEVDSIRGNTFREATNHDSHCHGYALFPSIAGTWTTFQPKPEPQCLFNLSIHSCEVLKHGKWHKGTFQLSQSLVNGL